MGFANTGCCNRESSAEQYAARGRIAMRVFQAADAAPLMVNDDLARRV